MSIDKIQILNDIANRLRIHSIESTGGSWYSASCSSIAELMSVLFFDRLRFTIEEPLGPSNDRFVLSKGHATPILYAAWAEAGLFPKDKLNDLKKLENEYRFKCIDFLAGSLGQGLSVSSGMAYSGKYFDKADYRVYCICDDVECDEGSIWEAFAFSSYYKLDNLVNIIDVDLISDQSQSALNEIRLDIYKRKSESFGWHTIIVDGHDVVSIINAFDEAEKVKDKPTCIIAKTVKDKSFLSVENRCLTESFQIKEIIQSINSLIINKTNKLGWELLPFRKPSIKVNDISFQEIKLSSLPEYKIGKDVATRLAYGNGLVKIGKTNDQIVVLDGDVKNSTYSIKFRDEFPDRFVECFIAEQNMTGVAVGMGSRNRVIPFVSTFAAFWTRAFDQLRMAALSKVNLNICGSHAGCSIGEDGPSQMGLEDICLFRSLPGSIVLYPSDAVSTEKAVELSANSIGIVYIRTTRPSTPVIYNNEEIFKIGLSKIILKSDSDLVLVIGAGVTLHEALRAAEQLKKININIRVMDLFSIKPLDVKSILENAQKTNYRIITVEDHYAEGGIGAAVSAALIDFCSDFTFNIKFLNVKSIPVSGKKEEVMKKFGIDSNAIINTVLNFL